MESSEELRKVPKNDLSLDTDTDKAAVAWESARVRSTKLAEAEALHAGGGAAHLAEQWAIAPLILLACQRLHAHAATEPQGDRIYRRKSPLQFFAVVTGQSLENDQDVDVAIRSCIPAGFGAE
jgi:hypothetical protein